MLARDAGIAVDALADPDGRVEVARCDELLERLDQLTRDPLIGVRLAAVRDPTTYDAAGLVLVAAPTLRAGLARAFRCQALWGDGERFRLDGDAVSFDPGSPHRRAHEILTECAFVETLGVVRLLVRPDAAPRSVRLRYAPAGALDGVLGCSVRRGARSSITLSARDLDHPIPRDVLSALGVFASPSTNSWTSAVGAIAARALVCGDATLVRVAEHFETSPRTLQRRLSDEGTTYQRVVDGARRQLASSLLAKGLAIPEVGTVLGYGDKASFYRAFRRWTGTTPRAAQPRR